jgi:shikimate kinase
MSGVGKSTLGRKLAERLGYDFLDIDEAISQEEGLSPQGIIDEFGDKKLLESEENAVANLEIDAPTVISPGGSVIYSEKAMQMLKDISTVVYLRTSFEDLAKRIPDFGKRGIVGLKEKSLKEVFDERRGLYEKYADIIVDISDSTDVNPILEKINDSLTTRTA